MRRIAIVIALFVVSSLGLALALRRPAPAHNAGPSNLARLYEGKDSPAFVAAAVPLAEKGDPEALFLLGQAYATGKGVERDYLRARELLELAARGGNAAAANELGSLTLDYSKDAREALPYFERAVALGMREPAAGNVRRMRIRVCDDWREFGYCLDLGKKFEAAWKSGHRNDDLDDAATAYALACEIKLHGQDWQPGDDAKAKPIPVCEHAIRLAETGSAAGLPKSAHYRGEIEYVQDRFKESLPWLKLGAERRFGLSAFLIGTLYEHGAGGEFPVDPQLALTWYERGADLKDPHAVERVQELWSSKVGDAADPAVVARGLATLERIGASDEAIETAQFRLRYLAAVSRNARDLPSLARKHIDPRFCPRHPEFFANQFWQVVLMDGSDRPGDRDTRAFPLEGTADAHGCVTFDAAALRKIRGEMAFGDTLAFQWMGIHRFVLHADLDGSGAVVFSLGVAQ